MLDDDFLKERQDIREKMLRYSRAIKKGEVPQIPAQDYQEDDVLKRRLQKSKKPIATDFELEQEEREIGAIYLKEDLINVRLEERKSFLKKLFAKRKKNKNEKKLEKSLAVQNSKKTSEKTKEKEGEKAEQKPNLTTQKVVEKQEIPPQKDEATQKQEIQAKQEIQTQQENFQDEKSLLLDNFAQTKEERNLSFHHLLFAFLLLAFSCAVFVPQIYIRNNIYYLSREIGTLRSQESVLNEENKEIKKELENMRFKNQILDYLE